MQITTILLSTVLALSTGAHGWKPDKDGVMVADDAAQACENSIIGDNVPTGPMVREKLTMAVSSPSPLLHHNPN
jgi:hypothetical protein